MELTSGILKSVESSFMINKDSASMYAIRYKGELFIEKGRNAKLFANLGSAKTALLHFVRDIFWNGEYYQEYKANLKSQTGYEVDFSETIKILPQYGKTDRFEKPESKQMFKDIRDKLLKEGIFTIEEIK
jgi:hypothetical protein